MLPAPIPCNEAERIASLRKMLLLSTPDEEAFNRVTRIAQRLFNVTIALISLIDTDRQWFKSCIGLPVRETGRDVSFCGHAIAAKELFVIEDARRDPRFSDNPLVTGDPKVIFYAGRPLRNSEGFLIGTLCIIDHEPRHFDHQDRSTLDDLGYWVEQLFLTRDLSDAQNEILNELNEAKRGSMLDPMLNIWRRDPVIDMLKRESVRAFRNKTNLSVLMIDIHRLGQINDAHGQPVGDEVLIDFAKRLGKLVRSYDCLGRYDDDEFVAVLPDADAAAATAVAANILADIDFPLIIGEQMIEVAATIGISSANYIDDTPEPMELMRRASAAILAAKQLGPNRLSVFGN